MLQATHAAPQAAAGLAVVQLLGGRHSYFQQGLHRTTMHTAGLPRARRRAHDRRDLASRKEDFASCICGHRFGQVVARLACAEQEAAIRHWVAAYKCITSLPARVFVLGAASDSC